jgi:flagellar basal-body rod protein FlgG
MLAMDTTSDNLSNVYTHGYKRGRANFQELLDARWLEGNQISSTDFKFDQAAVTPTGNPLDLAILGDGFFAVKLPGDQTGYTRDGEFFLDGDRKIVNANGFELDWDGDLPEEADDIHVNPDGTVMALEDEEWTEVGTIEVTRFTNPSGLQRYGMNVWLETEVSGEADTGEAGGEGRGQILGEALEGSNVNVGEEMVNMMTLQRSFEMSLKMFQQTDEMLYQAIHMRRG